MATGRLPGVGTMPVIVAVDHDHREVNVVAIGPVTFEDALNQLKSEMRAGGLSYPKFVDARGAGVLITPEENFRIAQKIRAYSREIALGPVAFVVSSDAACEAINVLAELVENVCEMNVFRDESEARAWLDARKRKQGAEA
jgi:hypothetical protein